MFSRCHQQLPLHQVLAGDHFGNRVLDLQAGIHFHEIETAVFIQQKLHGAGAAVVNGLGGLYRGVAHLLAQGLAHARSRSLLNHLLVAALHRAIALGQIDTIAGVIAKHLELDMAWPRQVLLHQHGIVAEAGQ